MQLLRYSSMSKWDPRLSLVRSPNEGGLNDRSCAVNWIDEAMQLAHRDRWCFAGFWISRSIKTRGYSMSPLDFITLTLADLSITMLIKAGEYHSSSCDGSNNFSTGFEGKKQISQSVLEAKKLVLMRLTIFLDFFHQALWELSDWIKVNRGGSVFGVLLCMVLTRQSMKEWTATCACLNFWRLRFP